MYRFCSGEAAVPCLHALAEKHHFVHRRDHLCADAFAKRASSPATPSQRATLNRTGPGRSAFVGVLTPVQIANAGIAVRKSCQALYLQLHVVGDLKCLEHQLRSFNPGLCCASFRTNGFPKPELAVAGSSCAGRGSDCDVQSRVRKRQCWPKVFGLVVIHAGSTKGTLFPTS